MIATYRHRGLRPADLVLASYPKSGSTWLRFLLSSALSGRDIDFDVVKDVSPPLGAHRNGPLVVPVGGRLVKSHEAPRFLGPSSRGPRSLFLVRDGRDVAISYFYHALRRGVVADDFDAFFDMYVNGRVSSLGSWQSHTRAWLDYADASDSVLTVRYEDLLADPAGTVASIDRRFGLGLDEARIRSALEHSTPARMRAKESSSRTLAAKTVNAAIPFVREAKAATWRENLAPGLCTAFEAAAHHELVALGYPLSTDPADLGH